MQHRERACLGVIIGQVQACHFFTPQNPRIHDHDQGSIPGAGQRGIILTGCHKSRNLTSRKSAPGWESFTLHAFHVARPVIIFAGHLFELPGCF